MYAYMYVRTSAGRVNNEVYALLRLRKSVIKDAVTSDKLQNPSKLQAAIYHNVRKPITFSTLRLRSCVFP